MRPGVKRVKNQKYLESPKSFLYNFPFDKKSAACETDRHLKHISAWTSLRSDEFNSVVLKHEAWLVQSEEWVNDTEADCMWYKVNSFM